MPLISTFGAGSGKGFGMGSCSGPDYVEATGGNATFTSGDYKIHVFTADGNLCVASRGKPGGSNTVDYMVVAGGGGGGSGTGGGGGAGGFRQSPGTASGSYAVSPLGASPAVALEVSKTAMPITVGGGGAGAPCGPGTPYRSSPGGDSVFAKITSAGGGGGNYGDGNVPLGPGSNGGPGGSGGGAGRLNNNPGQGNTPPTSPPQGQNGSVGPFNTGAGGGGAGGAASPNKTGGPGVTTAIAPDAYGISCGGNEYFSGGGGGGSDQTGDPGGPGGKGGGGRGGNRQNSPTAGTAGSTNSGGGGGGRGLPSSSGAAGGSGIVVIRYKFQN